MTSDSNVDLYDSSSWPSSSRATDASSSVTENWTGRGLTSTPATTFAPALKTTSETTAATDYLEATTELLADITSNSELNFSEELTDDENDCYCPQEIEGSGIDGSEDGSGSMICCENKQTTKQEGTTQPTEIETTKPETEITATEGENLEPVTNNSISETKNSTTVKTRVKFRNV